MQQWPRLAPMNAPDLLRPEDVDRMTAEEFVHRLGGAVEHAPWVAQRAWAERPFGSIEALARAMRAAVLRAGRDEQLALLRGHPELAGREAMAGSMTVESTGEQGRLGLLALSPQRMARLTAINRDYRERFGFPLIIALRLHDTLDAVFAEAERRLAHEAEVEWRAALEQVCEVMRGRLLGIFGTASSPAATNSSPIA